MRRSSPQLTLADPRTRDDQRRQAIQLPFRSRWAILTMRWAFHSWRERGQDLVYLVRG